MEYLERNDGHFPVEQELVQFESSVEEAEGLDLDIMGLIRRRWWIIFIVVIIFCGSGFPMILRFMKKQYLTSGAIEIAQIENAILYSDSRSERPLPNYDNFKNTQATIISSDKVLSRVASDLKERNLSFFEGVVDYQMALRTAILQTGAISIEPDRRSHLIRIKMTSSNPREAEVIVNSILQNYMAIAVQDQMRIEERTLGILEDQRKQMELKIDRQRQTIRQLADEYGEEDLEGRQQMKYEELASLHRELIGVNIRRIALETQLRNLQTDSEQTISEQQLTRQKNMIISNDFVMQALMEDISRYKDLVLIAQQTMTEENPEYIQRKEILENLKQRKIERENELFDKLEVNLLAEQKKVLETELSDLQKQLNEVTDLQNELRSKLEEQDLETIKLGRKQLAINDQKEQLELSKSRLEEYNQRIEQLRIENNRPERISVADVASSIPAMGKRKKMAMALGAGSMALGCLLAFLVEKGDKRFHTPQEVVKRIGVRILGTTTSSESVNRKHLSQQLIDDYQTIRANLGLLDGEPGSKIILVSSPGVKDGKTTFSINLATSFAQAGQKTLLLDADLRKPDIALSLGLPAGLRGLQDYLFGKDLESCLFQHHSVGFSVLASDERNCTDALDLLAHHQTRQRLINLKRHFDIIIIDSPPVLAFADSVVLAKLSDSVVLTSFVGHTSHTEMKEAIQRLEQVGAHVIGTVVNNVKIHQSYRSYGYGYGYGPKTKRKRNREKEKRQSSLLIASLSEANDSNTPYDNQPESDS